MNFNFSKLCKQDWSDRLNAIDLVPHIFATDLAFKIECNCYLLWLHESSGLQDLLLLLQLAAVLLQAHLFRETKETVSRTTCDCQWISRERVIKSNLGYKGILKIAAFLTIFALNMWKRCWVLLDPVQFHVLVGAESQRLREMSKLFHELTTR